ncbi:MAG TPA: aldehyde ferredoxin oxidoreductase family protein [Dehalococcoidia bacterium]|nr:aldehyde ferredoxin oxidoreductase family protein [Dehalococcoidia bacterium]
MSNGECAFNGRMLNVNLNSGELIAEEFSTDFYRSYFGGYGAGSRLLFDRVPKGADPLGPENILGVMPGLLSGTPFFGSRFQVVAKSPKTGGWGDANGGGDFGPWLKNAGWDGVLVSGISGKPVYLFIDDDKAELRDASDLWGLDAIETEAKLKERHGKKTSVACIGPAGEKLSLMAGVCNDRGRVAARSGLGAVMGSKKLKAVAVVSSRAAILARDKEVQEKVGAALDAFVKPLVDFFHTVGTPGIAASSAISGDAPIKNWGGVGATDFPESAGLAGAAYAAKMDRPYGCWHCPVSCGAESKDSDNPKYPFPRHTHRAEYETMTSFGGLVLNSDLDSLTYLNHLCNAYGLDTIAAGAVIAFAVECYENGVITKEDTDGIALRWGNTAAIIEMLEKIVRREGFGDVLADGIRKAAAKIGPASEPFAMEIGGEELPMHDPKLDPDFYITYKLDPTPARHTQWESNPRPGWNAGTRVADRAEASGRGPFHKGAAEYLHVVNSCGLCFFVTMCGPNDHIHEWINATTGWDMTLEEVRRVGERIANLRMAFEVREGNNPMRRKIPARLVGDPPMSEGPHAGVKLDVKTLEREYLEACGWDAATCKPTRAKLVELGLSDVADAVGA